MKVVDGGAPKQFRFSAVPAGKILIADNNQTNLEILAHALETAGMAVELRDSCENIPDILGRAEKAGSPFDLCIIEAALASDAPGDFVHIRRIRKAGPPLERIPIIATSDIFAGNTGKCLEAGCSGFLSKPVRREQLFQMIHHLIHVGGRAGASGQPDRKRAEGQGNNEASGPGQTILLAEDNPVNQKLVAAILNKAGYQVTVAEDGRKAVDKYIAAPDDYSMILMDVQMPELDGIAAAGVIRQWEADQDRMAAVPGKKPRHVCIVAVTAGAVDQEKSRYVQAGMDDLLFKPIQGEMLLGMIGKWLEKEGQHVRQVRKS
jgi:CheY-like chemotaxis protein